MTPVTDDLLVTLSGLGFGLTLIVAIGAQNAFVLRQGLRREHVALVVVTCAASDVLLIGLGVGGMGAVLAGAPTLLTAVRVGGAAFLLGYAALAARRALRPAALEAIPGGPVTQRTATLATALALTWLNPHVYLDTVLLLGSVAGTHGDQRWLFGAGAALGSVAWFAGLGYGAVVLRPLFARPVAWRALDAGVALVMTAIAGALLTSA
jgi:L-lysine exporter family protein LysE/ArgO